MRALIFLMIFGVTAQAAFAGCARDKFSVRGPWGQVEFSAEVADTPKSREVGLMNRASLARFSGMVFVYDKPSNARFWMKNTLIPLDMLFFDKNGALVTLKKMATPESLDVIDGGEGVLVVLEINGGLADTLGITPDSEAQHPAFGPQGVWACQ